MVKTISCKNNFGDYEDIPVEKFAFRPSAYGFIYHDGKVITLTNKSSGKLWFPGGGVDLGERLVDGLKREILEETGITVDVEKMVLARDNFFYFKPTDEAYHALVFFYLCKPKELELIADDLVDDLESEKPRWVKVSDIKESDIGDMAEDIYAELKKIN